MATQLLQTKDKHSIFIFNINIIITVICGRGFISVTSSSIVNYSIW